jgi:hypothetical protein
LPVGLIFLLSRHFPSNFFSLTTLATNNQISQLAIASPGKGGNQSAYRRKQHPFIFAIPTPSSRIATAPGAIAANPQIAPPRLKQLQLQLSLTTSSSKSKQTSIAQTTQSIPSFSTMLLPSALPCDVRRSSRFTPSGLFSTPPPFDTGYPSGNGLLGTCRALQSLLNRSPAPSTRRSTKPQRLQSPLPLNTPRRSPRAQKTARPVSPRQTPPPQTAPLTPPPPPSAPARGANKRRRDSDESEETIPRNRFATPKRSRHIPYNMPLGLSSTDFYSLHSPPVTQSPPSPRRRVDMDYSFQFGARIDADTPMPSIEVTECAPALDQDVWTPQEDQDLIELVLEKCRLSRAEWDECARQMGRRGVGHRFQALVGEGCVGLRPRR